MKLISIPVFDGPITAAHAAATGDGKPLLVSTPVYADDRGWSLMNLFQRVLTSDGQVNYSTMYPYVVKAWHRHQHQTDFWLCLHGHIKIGLYDQSTDTAWQAIIGEKRFGIVIIPPLLWHGLATVGPTSAGLLYYVTQAYNPTAPDEERREYDSIADFPWDVQHQ